jgi:hypothetical protein
LRPPPKPAPRPFEIPVGPAPPPRTDLGDAARPAAVAADNDDEDDEDEEIWELEELSDVAVADIADVLHRAMDERYVVLAGSERFPMSCTSTRRLTRGCCCDR